MAPRESACGSLGIHHAWRKARQTYLGLDDTAQAALADGEEDVRSAGRPAGVNGDADGAVRRVLEAGGHGQCRDEFAVHLGLGGARADGAPGDEVGDVLWRDGVEELAARREAHVRDVKEECPSEAEALVDLEGAVHLRVVDETLPAYGRAGLLEVDTHDDEQVVLGAIGVSLEELGILERGVDVVNRAGAVDH